MNCKCRDQQPLQKLPDLRLTNETIHSPKIKPKALILFLLNVARRRIKIKTLPQVY